MSARSIAAFADLSKARRRVQTLADGLKVIASPEILKRATDKIQEQVGAVAEKYAGKHQVTGAALDSVRTAASGGLIQLNSIGYLRFHAWWIFRRGMPPFILKQGAIILASEIRGALGGTYGNLGTLAGDVLGEVAEAKERRRSKAVQRREAKGPPRKRKGTR